MKRVLFLFIIVLTAGSVMAQPKRSRVQQTEQKKSPSSAMSMRAQLTYPTALDIPEEVVWRRDIYRELDLTDDANAGLYFPVEPQGKQLNLFTYIFKLAQNGYIPVYEYPTDGSDNFTDDAKVDMKTILDNYHIFYEEQNGKLKVDNSDIPSAEVKKYYLKESAYYDQANSSFHIKVLALCPVMLREDDFGGEATQYPLFWVKYGHILVPVIGCSRFATGCDFPFIFSRKPYGRHRIPDAQILQNRICGNGLVDISRIKPGKFRNFIAEERRTIPIHIRNGPFVTGL